MSPAFAGLIGRRGGEGETASTRNRSGSCPLVGANVANAPPGRVAAQAVRNGYDIGRIVGTSMRSDWGASMLIVRGDVVRLVGQEAWTVELEESTS